MHNFLGIFLCQFALVKLYDLKGFARGFARYDIIGMHSIGYAYVYPFIELALGLAFLSYILLLPAYIVTIAAMVLGIIGVARAMHEKLRVPCACMGSFLRVPLSGVTLTENIIMGAMAIILLATY